MSPLFKTILVSGVAAISLASCQESTESNEAEGAAAPELPISLNAVMVGMVDEAGDYIWAAGNGDMPTDDEGWYKLRNSAYRAIVAGKVIQLAGTGPDDAAWVADPEWQRLADEMTSVGMEALAMAEARQTDGWEDVGNQLVEKCESCHAIFKPEIPSQGIMHEPTENETEGESVFD